jgi:flagellar motor switch protein FliN/FliY
VTSSTPTTNPALAPLVQRAAATAIATLASAEPLTAGSPSGDMSVIDATGRAVIASFAGALSGELALVVDASLATALDQSTIGELDLGQALAPTMQAIAAALGNIALGPVQVLDARRATQQVMANADALVVPLLAGADARGAVLVGIAAAPGASFAPAGDAGVPNQRLELLRTVEMDVNAELGRTRMTVNDLLGLRAGAIIELDRAAGAPADVLVNGHLVARGEVVVIDENYALRITQIVSDEGR